ncbi:MAG: helix-turn-helix domain-containing protein [Firmicutes bacterium]|nr:helix-turn-helix domain-containing protein [Alicyclobacillaceae bacterium]MCL6497773.1 helix-turn-helix domain-containing protein [Bacillota bacterium]
MSSHGAGRPIRAIARELGIAPNTVWKYLRAPEVPAGAPAALAREARSL